MGANGKGSFTGFSKPGVFFAETKNIYRMFAFFLGFYFYLAIEFFLRAVGGGVFLFFKQF